MKCCEEGEIERGKAESVEGKKNKRGRRMEARVARKIEKDTIKSKGRTLNCHIKDSPALGRVEG